MSAILTASGIQFSDSTTQTSAGVPFAGGTMSGLINMQSLISRNVPVKQWSYHWTQPNANGSSVDMLYNTGSYSDIAFQFFLNTRTGSNGFFVWTGIFGGYGGNYNQRVALANTAFSLTFTSISSGYGKISVTNNYDLTSSNQGMEAMALIFTTEGVGAYNGTIYS
jgi:hypothetical protein